MLKDILSRRMPALLTRMSSEPNVSTACSTRPLPPAHVLTSSPLTAASPPFFLMRSTTSWAGCDVGAALAVQAGAEVVDDDLGALGCEHAVPLHGRCHGRRR